MNASQLHQDLATGCLVEVASAACNYLDQARGLTARQQFFIYPDGTVVSLTMVDGSNNVLKLCGDDEATFRHIHKGYFQ